MALGDPKRPKSDMAYLLLVANQVVEEEKIWVSGCVDPPLPSSSTFTGQNSEITCLTNQYREDWAYTFTQFNEDSQHIPLSTTRHISTMFDGAPSSSACGHLSHLEVHKLLQCGVEVVYPEGLNGGLGTAVGLPPLTANLGLGFPHGILPTNSHSCR